MILFNIDFDVLLRVMVPRRLQQWPLMALLKAMYAGIKESYWKFRIERMRSIYELEHRQHVAHLEAVLNDTFDMAFRRIRVEDAPIQYQPLYLFRDAELKPQYLYTEAEGIPRHLYTDYEVDFAGIDFIVKVQYTIPYDAAQMRALIDHYKTPGKAYLIEETI